MAITTKRRYGSKQEIDISSPDGNVFFLLGRAKVLAGQLGLDAKKIVSEMMSGDYENALTVFDGYFGEYVDLVRCSDDDEGDDEC